MTPLFSRSFRTLFNAWSLAYRFGCGINFCRTISEEQQRLSLRRTSSPSRQVDFISLVKDADEPFSRIEGSPGTAGAYGYLSNAGQIYVELVSKPGSRHAWRNRCRSVSRHRVGDRATSGLETDGDAHGGAWFII